MGYLGWLAVFCLGALIGSFLNVCICRLPENRSVVYPPSQCPLCGERLGPADLIPIFSYLFLKGRCRYCRGRIPRQYPLVEAGAGALFLLAVVKYGFSWDALRIMILAALVIPAAVIDQRYKIIPDKLNLTAFFLALPLLFQSKAVFQAGLLGFLTGGGLLLFVALVSRGGMGGGDVKLAAVLGLLLGWPYLPVALFIAFAAGSCVGLPLLLLKRTRLKEAVPFGPYLALGALCASFGADKILIWYWGFFT